MELKYIVKKSFDSRANQVPSSSSPIQSFLVASSMGTFQETFTGLPKGAVVDERIRDLFCLMTAMSSSVFNCNVKGIIILLLLIVNIQY